MITVAHSLECEKMFTVAHSLECEVFEIKKMKRFLEEDFEYLNEGNDND